MSLRSCGLRAAALAQLRSPDEAPPQREARRRTRYPGPASQTIPACRCAHAGYVLAHFVHATHAVVLPGAPMKTIGIDVGGTFTDIVLADTATGAVAIHKVSTTPHDPSVGVMQGILAICAANRIPVGEISYVMHGTTTATNAVLENKGARTGLVTNEGFRDILHIA